MLYKAGYISWDFNSKWIIDDSKTLAYLKNVEKPDQVNKENINYVEFAVEGQGTQFDPYIIKTAIQLQKINENLEAYYKLGSDIDLTGVEWISIGNEQYPFKGTIDGNGFKITNLVLDKNLNNIGLFGYNSGTLNNVTLENFNIKGNNNVGILAGYNDGIINDCKILNSDVTGKSNVGGLIGYTIVNVSGCSSNASVTGVDQVGGLIRICICK